MCKYKSAIVLKNGDILHSNWTDSHEELIDFYELDDTRNREGFVRVEFAPESIDDYKDIDKYLLKVDEGNVPDWWSEDFANHITSQMKDIVARTIITKDRKCLIGGPWIVAGAKIDLIRSARVVYLFSSQVGEMRGSSQVGEMWGSSQVGKMRESSQIKNDYRNKK